MTLTDVLREKTRSEIAASLFGLPVSTLPIIADSTEIVVAAFPLPGHAHGHAPRTTVMFMAMATVMAVAQVVPWPW